MTKRTKALTMFLRQLSQEYQIRITRTHIDKDKTEINSFLVPYLKLVYSRVYGMRKVCFTVQT